jgi:hypothetical protein
VSKIFLRQMQTGRNGYMRSSIRQTRSIIEDGSDISLLRGRVSPSPDKKRSRLERCHAGSFHQTPGLSISTLTKAALNIIDKRRAKKLLLKKGTEFAVYYHRLTLGMLTSVVDGDTAVQEDVLGKGTASPELQSLSQSHKYIFCSSQKQMG